MTRWRNNLTRSEQDVGETTVNRCQAKSKWLKQRVGI